MAGRPRKFSENEALILGKELIDWLKADEKNIFITKFLSERDVSRQNLKDLQEYYPAFKDLVEKAKHIQEGKILDLGARNKINVIMGLFVLKNHFGYADKIDQRTEITAHGYNQNDLKDKTEEELRDMLLNMTQRPNQN